MSTLGTHMEEELRSQPEMWRRAMDVAAAGTALPEAGEKVAILGCGTSWFVAQAFAALREELGLGLTDAFTASEAPLASREYDSVILLSRSGTTSEVIEIAEQLRGRSRLVGIVGDEDSPLPELVSGTVALGFADEKSVVQTRFATTALALLRAHLGDKVHDAARQAEAVLETEPAAHLLESEQMTFLGTGFSVGIAHEAALKLRESAQAWTESYPAMEYRHGPKAITAAGRVVWAFGQVPDGLAQEVQAMGGTFEHNDIDPMADLVRAHLAALGRARALGLDPDHPRNLTRSVILDS